MIELARKAMFNKAARVAVLMLTAAAFLPTNAQALTGGPGWAWGWNAFGQLGNGTYTDSSTPVAVSMPSGVTFSAITGAFDHSLALDSSGHAWAWGWNQYGQLGNGTFNCCNATPVAVSMPSGVTFTAIAGGYVHGVALDSSGPAWAWGWNGYGQLGNGTTTDSSTPVAVSMPTGVTFSA